MKKLLFTILIFCLATVAYSADTKTTALTEMTTPVETDILYVVDDPGGTALSQKITKANLQKNQSPTGDVDFTNTNSLSIGSFTFATLAAGTADGEFRYIAAPTGLTNKQFTYYTTALQYLLAYDTLPTADGSMPTYNATNDDFDWTVPTGSIVASSAEVNTGTDNAKFISPDALAGSNAFTKDTGWVVYDSDIDTSVADGLQYFLVPQSWDGMNLTYMIAGNVTAGVTGVTSIQLRRVRGVTPVDMLSTIATIDTTELDTTTAATPYVINAANDDLATGDKIFIDIDTITTTAAIGLSVTIEARLP